MTPTELAPIIKAEADANPDYKSWIMRKKIGTNEYAHSAYKLKGEFPNQTASLRYDGGDTERNRQYRAFQIVREELAGEHEGAGSVGLAGLEVAFANVNLRDDVVSAMDISAIGDD